MQNHSNPEQEEIFDNSKKIENISAHGQTNYNTNERSFRFFRKISWSAIIAGVLVAVVVQFLFTLLGFGIGIGTINPESEMQPFQGLGTGTLIWWIVTMLISLFAGAWVAGRQCNLPEKMDRAIHGVIMWCLFTVLSVYFFTSAVGSIMGGIGSVIGKTLSVAGQGIQAVAPEAYDYVKNNTNLGNINGQKIMNEAEQILNQTGKKDLQPGQLEQTADEMKSQAQNTAESIAQDPTRAREEMNQLINKLIGNSKEIFNDADKDAMVNIIVSRTNKTRPEAEAQVNNWITAAKQTKESFQNTKEQVVEQARETGQDVANTVSKIAIYSFIGLLLGAIVSAFGSIIVTPSYISEMNEKVVV